MGAWGPGLFADDEAVDVRDDYRCYLADAQSDEGATDAIAKSYGASFDDLGATTAFWLALSTLTYINWRKLGKFEIRGNHLCCLASPRSKPIPESRFIHLGLFKPVTQGEAKSPYIGIDDRDGKTLETILEGVLQPYWDDPTLSPHRPGFD